MLLAICLGCQSQTQIFDNLAALAMSGGTQAALNDPSIQSRLQILLGDRYQEFSDNFDVVVPPFPIAGGGYFFEGWRRDLRLYQASAFVALPDGRLYVALLTPKVHVVTYQTNDAASPGELQPNIQAWAQRFDHAKVEIVPLRSDNKPAQ